MLIDNVVALFSPHNIIAKTLIDNRLISTLERAVNNTRN